MTGTAAWGGHARLQQHRQGNGQEIVKPEVAGASLRTVGASTRRGRQQQDGACQQDLCSTNAADPEGEAAPHISEVTQKGRRPR